MMKIAFFLLFLICLSSCTGNKHSNATSHSKDRDESDHPGKKPGIAQNNDSLAYNSPKQYDSKTEPIVHSETTFIVRDITEASYHTIYIDNKKGSEFKKNKSKARITKSLQQKISEIVATEKNEEKLQNFNLPQFWIPLYQYKKDYYLYEPCDGIFEFTYLVTKDAVTHLYYDGPSISAISSSERINSQHYYFEFHESYGIEKLDIYIIDPKQKTAVFKFYEDHHTWYQLFTSTTSLHSFNVIVNDCRTQKESEFKFEDIDFEALIEKIK